MARVHRIGQTKPVHIYRLVSAGTVEERIVQRWEDITENRIGKRGGEEIRQIRRKEETRIEKRRGEETRIEKRRGEERRGEERRGEDSRLNYISKWLLFSNALYFTFWSIFFVDSDLPEYLAFLPKLILLISFINFCSGLKRNYFWILWSTEAAQHKLFT